MKVIVNRRKRSSLYSRRDFDAQCNLFCMEETNDKQTADRILQYSKRKGFKNYQDIESAYNRKFIKN